jgi:hypothetical protein
MGTIRTEVMACRTSDISYVGASRTALEQGEMHDRVLDSDIAFRLSLAISTETQEESCALDTVTSFGYIILLPEPCSSRMYTQIDRHP